MTKPNFVCFCRSLSGAGCPEHVAGLGWDYYSEDRWRDIVVKVALMKQKGTFLTNLGDL